jgi:hypothetical protein
MPRHQHAYLCPKSSKSCTCATCTRSWCLVCNATERSLTTDCPATVVTLDPVGASPNTFPPVEALRPTKPHAPRPSTDGAEDVVAALVAAGYKKQIAADAALACSGAERATIEDWTRAALRRCARGVA